MRSALLAEGRGTISSRAFCLQMIEKQPIEFEGKIVLACGQRNIFFAHRMNRAASIIGIDIDAESIRQNDVIHEGVVGGLHAIPLADSSVDVIVLVDTIEHSEQIDSSANAGASFAVADGLVLLHRTSLGIRP
jgi:hypothetical protein